MRTVSPASDACLLAEFAAALPPAYVVDRWQVTAAGAAQVQAVAAPDWEPARQTLCDAAGGGAAEGTGMPVGRAEVVRRSGAGFCLTTVVDVDAPQAGLLVSDEPYLDDLAATVDGRPATVHCANVLWAAVEVPAGRHTVSLRRRVQVGPLLVSGGTGLAVVLWGLWRCRPRRRDAV